MMQTKIFTDDRILEITNRIKKVFIFFICIGILNAIYHLLKLSEGLPQRKSPEEIINLFVFLFLYIGLRLRKNWFIPLVLISSAWLLLTTGLHILQPVADVFGLFAKIFSMVFFMFYAYQMYFFSRREVKAYFCAKETIFF
jgi:hypothetical protein